MYFTVEKFGFSDYYVELHYKLPHKKKPTGLLY